MARRLPPGSELPPPREADGGISQFRRRRGLGARPSWRTPNENLRAAARAASINPDMADTSGEAPIEWNQRPRRECCHTDTPRRAELPLCNQRAGRAVVISASPCGAADLRPTLRSRAISQSSTRKAERGHLRCPTGPDKRLPSDCTFCIARTEESALSRSTKTRSGGDKAHVQLCMAEAHLSALGDGQRTEKRMRGSFLLVLQSLGRATQVLERRRRIDLVRHQHGRGPRAQLETGSEPLDEQSLLEREPTDGPDRQRGLKTKSVDRFVLAMARCSRICPSDQVPVVAEFALTARAASATTSSRVLYRMRRRVGVALAIKIAPVRGAV
jgi:hypothetical protein